MDEKTRELRDIFLGVAGEATITERQEAARGTLASVDVDQRLRSVVRAMRERYGFRTSLSTDDLAAVATGFFAGDSDAAIARELAGEPSPSTVARARLDLHLVADRDLDAPVDLAVLRQWIDEGRSASEIAEAVEVSESTVRRYRRAIEAQRERRRVGDRYREQLAELCDDRALTERFTADVSQTGLEDATDDVERNVSF